MSRVDDDEKESIVMVYVYVYDYLRVRPKGVRKTVRMKRRKDFNE